MAGVFASFLCSQFVNTSIQVPLLFSILQSQIKSTPFILFVCDKLLPLSTWNMIATAEQQDQVQLRLLKVFAEMCAFCGPIENASSRTEAIYTVLLVSEFSNQVE